MLVVYATQLSEKKHSGSECHAFLRDDKVEDVLFLGNMLLLKVQLW